MGLFEFLKVTVGGKKKVAGPVKGAKGPRRAANTIEVDSRSYPIAALSSKGFALASFDGSLVQGQNAKIVVKVDDEFGKFSFQTTVSIGRVQDGKCFGEWIMLPPEVATVLRTYGQRRKPAAR